MLSQDSIPVVFWETLLFDEEESMNTTVVHASTAGQELTRKIATGMVPEAPIQIRR